MKIFPPALEISENEGFAPEKDLFQRRDFGIGLTNLIRVVDDPLVIALDAPWGSGKTTFVKMLAGHLRNEGHPVIYFDAFANDHISDAFVAIAGEVVALSKRLEKQSSPAHKHFIKKAAKAGRSLLRSGAKIGVKAATLGILDAADVSALASVTSDIAAETSTKSEEYIMSLLMRQSSERESVEGFRKALSNLAKTLSSKPKNSEANSDGRPLVFVIDELDRCKPPFALELLEKVKHIFSVKGVHFVLVTHLLQLESSVRFGYGADIDARTYLQKFYNLIVHLPGDEPYARRKVSKKYIEYLRPLLLLDQNAAQFIEYVAEAKELSLRALERISTHVALAIAFTTSNKQEYFRPGPILAGLCILKVLEPRLFQKAKSGKLSFSEAAAVFGFDDWSGDRSEQWAERWWRYALEPELDEIEFRDFGTSAFVRFNIDDRTEIVPIVANHVVDRMKIPES